MMAKPMLPKVAQEIVRRIAADTLDIQILDTRHSDSLDFHDVAVWEVRAALEAAYLAGVARRRKPTKK